MTTPESDRTAWHTSNGAAACVEVSWHISSYSASHGDCIEVAPAPGAVLVRDTKNRTGPALTVPTAVPAISLRGNKAAISSRVLLPHTRTPPCRGLHRRGLHRSAVLMDGHIAHHQLAVCPVTRSGG
jgi:hypothetical protein